MIQTQVGVRELKARLSAYLRQVKAGGTVLITERGEPIGRIVPLSLPTAVQLDALKQAGVIAWSGEKLPLLAPLAQAKGDWTVAELLVEDRE
jgi:prevent-host-death family protein